MDPFRSNRYFLTANRCLKSVEVFCNRRAVRGRATRVRAIKTGPSPITDDISYPPLRKYSEIQARLQPRTQPPTAGTSAPQPPPSSRPSRLLLLVDQLKRLKIGPSRVDEIVSRNAAQTFDWWLTPRTKDWAQPRLWKVPDDGQDVDSDDEPDVSLQRYWDLEDDQLSEFTGRQHAIVKESWSSDSHANECEMFSTVKDGFGVPRVLFSERFGEDTTHRAEPWSLWGNGSSAPEA
jgi:hypothetical protein